MAHEKMRIRNSTSTLTGLVITTLLVMGLFFGMYQYVEDNFNSAGVVLDSRYNESHSNMSKTQSVLEGDVRKIQLNVDLVAEADSTYEVALNGLKGIGNTLKLGFRFVTSTLKLWTSFLGFSSEFIPPWALALIFTGILVFVLFLVIKVLKGEPNM